MGGIFRSSIVRAFASGGPKSFRRCFGASLRSGCRKGAIPRGRIGRRQRNKRGIEDGERAQERGPDRASRSRTQGSYPRGREGGGGLGRSCRRARRPVHRRVVAAIRESGRTNLAVLGDIEALLERARAT